MGAAIVLYGLGMVAGYAFRKASVEGSLLAAVTLGDLYIVVLLSNVMSIISSTDVKNGMVGAAVIVHWASRSSVNRRSPRRWLPGPKSPSLDKPDALYMVAVLCIPQNVPTACCCRSPDAPDG